VLVHQQLGALGADVGAVEQGEVRHLQHIVGSGQPGPGVHGDGFGEDGAQLLVAGAG
jgi:hypothetical protein